MAKEARYITNEEMFELVFDNAKSRWAAIDALQGRK